MSFEKCLYDQIKKHSAMQPQDVVKLCYQAAYGTGHLINDTSVAEKSLADEINETSPNENIPLYEDVSEDFVRVNIAAWKHRNLPQKWLLNMFKASADLKADGEITFRKYLEIAESCLQIMPFSKEDWEKFLLEYSAQGMPSVHHTRTYREAEAPAYRVVKSDFVDILPVLEKIAKLDKKPCVISIDGRAASGKTTLAKILSKILDADIIAMDDFFLPFELRTPERLSESGGNIHYERFAEEVISNIRNLVGFSYKAFNCHDGTCSNSREIRSKEVRIVEGSYSMHPKFGNYADIKIYLTVSPEEQRKRILERNGAEMAKIFEKKWIPMEEKYFETFCISNKSDIILNTQEER